MKKKNELLGSVLVMTAGILWGLISIYIGVLKAAGLGPMEIVAIRVWVSAIIMLLFGRKKLKIKVADIWCFAGAGILSITLFNYCYFSNIILTSPGVAAVLMYTSPVFIMIMSAVFFREKITIIKIISCIMIFAGCVFVSGVSTGLSLKGLGLGLVSGLGYALYSIFGRFAENKGYSTLTVMVYTFIFACIGTAPFTDFSKISDSLGSGGVKIFLFMVFGAVIVTLLAYGAYTLGLKYIETGKAGVIAAIEIVVSALIGAAVFHESFGIGKVFGIVLILFALAIMNLKKSK